MSHSSLPDTSIVQTGISASSVESKYWAASEIPSCEGYLLAIACRSLDPKLTSKTSAVDLLQQTYLEAYRDIDRFHGQPTIQLRAWLRRILVNNIANERRYYHSSNRNLNREQCNFENSTLESHGQTPDVIAEIREEIAKLESAIQALTPEHSQVIRLRNLECKSFQEIGTELQLSSDAARRHWKRAMKRLKSMLKSKSRP